MSNKEFNEMRLRVLTRYTRRYDYEDVQRFERIRKFFPAR